MRWGTHAYVVEGIIAASGLIYVRTLVFLFVLLKGPGNLKHRRTYVQGQDTYN